MAGSAGAGGAAMVGVDVGGTFTDLVLLDPAAQPPVRLAKVPTTPDNQAVGVLAALAAAGADLAAVGGIVHGTTTTTNALLERKIARAGLITTKGFRDTIELGRRTRPTSYGLTGWFEPLIPRERRLEVTERMDADGEVVTPLAEDEVRAAAERLLAMGCESLVIHFLHAYRNPAHERRAGEIARAVWPNRYITLGSAILSEFREYERGTTATVNACIQPVLDRYLERLADDLAARGYRRELLVMQGNGGTVAARIAAETAVATVMSGPASGVIAAAYTGRAAGRESLITYDMGGTSTDVGLILGGEPKVQSELDLEYGMPIHVPLVDVHTIGAGGGSLALINEAGLLQVGPESAGAVPGPICYGRGGARPTITDANLVLGRLPAGRLLAVDNPVSLADIERAIAEQVGHPLGLGSDEAAGAILRVANDRMAGAIRMVSIERGHDPRDFALFAFGGAGPLHATALARELAIPEVIVPARPGITNALGCVAADLRHDYVNTLNQPLDQADMDEVARLFAAQIEEGRRTVERQGVPVERIDFLHTADMQFLGQSHLLPVALPGPAPGREWLAEAFARAYFERFAVELPEIRPVLVNLHTAVLGRRPPIDLRLLVESPERGAVLADAVVEERPVWFAGRGRLPTPVYRRGRLPPGARFAGPAIVEQLDTTVVVEPGDRVEMDVMGNLVIRVGGG